MRVAALVLGLLGGLIAMIFGVGGVALGGAGGSAGLQLVSVAVPIAALVGAGLVVSKPIPDGALMGGSQVGYKLVFDF